MALIASTETLAAVTLRDVSIVLQDSAGSHTTTGITDFTVDWSVDKDDATGGASTVKQTVLGQQQAHITAKGFNGTALSSNDLFPGRKIIALIFNDTAVTPLSQLGSTFFTAFPASGMCFGNRKGHWTSKPSTWEIEIIPNVIAGGIT